MKIKYSPARIEESLRAECFLEEELSNLMGTGMAYQASIKC
jgi:hypothetical protein